MSTAPFTHRRRVFGRAPSPPTWACYEQIPFDDGCDSDTSDRDSCSEDDEDYSSPEQDEPDTSMSSSHVNPTEVTDRPDSESRPANEMEGVETESPSPAAPEDGEEVKKDVKGKQRAVDTEKNETPRRREGRRKHRHPIQTLRPILTIQKSQGFVWNQDLFVPPYIRDRYVVSTSPPKPSGAVTTSASSFNPMEYDVEVVEIHIEEDELKHIIP